MKKFRVILTYVLVAMLSFTLVACTKTNNQKNNKDNIQVKSETSWKDIEQKGKLVVGLCAAYPPFESRNEKTGKFEGFDIDLANALSKELSLEVEIKDADWQALLGGLNKGDFDVLITCMSKKEAASNNVNMSDVYYKLNDVVVVKDNEISIKELGDLKDKVIGVQLGSGSEQIVDKMEGLKDIKRYNYNPEAFIDLKNERIDAIVVGYAYAVNYLKENKGFKILDTPVESAEIVMVMKHGADTLTEKLNGAIEKIKQNGEFDKAIEKWLKVN